MPTRKAIIITSPGVSPNYPNFLAGVVRDGQNFSAYLLSAIGGAWTQDEIKTFHNPSVEELYGEFNYTNVDYLVVYFAGHGSHNGAQTLLQINPLYSVGETNLVGCAKRKLTIIDACRVKVQRGLGLGDPLHESQKIQKYIDRKIARTLYDQAIFNAPLENHTLYACAVGQTAKESSVEGGYFTSALLKSSLLRTPRKHEVLTVGESASLAAQTMIDQGIEPSNQQVCVTSQTITFPFAVHPKLPEFA